MAYVEYPEQQDYTWQSFLILEKKGSSTKDLLIEIDSILFV